MKSGLLASVSIAALFVASGAGAADLPVKARPMPVAAAPVYSWTGCYVGAHVGWGRGRHNHTQSNFASFSGGSNVLSAASGRADSSGGLFGGQVGCNYQFASNWVVGIQGDIAGTNLNGQVQDALRALVDPDTRNIVGVKTDWLSSVTGRIGYTFYANQGMFYAKGGGAWVHNIWDLHDTFKDYGAATASETRTGWTVGGGIEWKFTQNWSGFAEYNYYSFGGDKILAVDTAGAATIRTFTSNKQEISTVKIGVNYMFTQGPVVARY